MADNVVLNSGSGGDTLAADEVGGVKIPRSKIVIGADGTNDGDVSSANPLPVSVSGTALTRLADIETNTDSGAVVGNGAAATAQRVTLANDGTGIIATVGTVTAITNALPAGTNNIGDVDVLSLPALPAGTNNIGDVDVLSLPALPAGNNNIGDVDVASLPAVTNAGTFAVQDSEKVADDAAFTVGTTKVQPVGFLADETAPDSVNEGDVGVARMTLDRVLRALVELESNSIRAGGTALTPKFAVIDFASSGDNTVVAAVTSKKIRVLALFLGAAGTVNVRFESAASGTALTGQMNLVANVGFVLPFNPLGWFETIAGELLNLELSAAVSVDGSLVYIEV